MNRDMVNKPRNKIKTLLAVMAGINILNLTGCDSSVFYFDDSYIQNSWACPETTAVAMPFLTSISNVTLIDPFNDDNLADGLVSYYSRAVAYDATFGYFLYENGELIAETDGIDGYETYCVPTIDVENTVIIDAGSS